MTTGAPPDAGVGHDTALRGIGAVASATGVSERALRYYEELGGCSARRPIGPAEAGSTPTPTSSGSGASASSRS